MGTASTTTPAPMIRLLRSPRISLSSLTRTSNHSTEKHSKGVIRGNCELLKAVTLITMSGPNRYTKNRQTKPRTKVRARVSDFTSRSPRGGP